MQSEKTFEKGRTLLALGAIILIVVVIFLLFSSISDISREEIVARVGDEVITRHDVDIRVRQSVVLSQDGGLAVPEASLFDLSLEDLIMESLLFQDALREGFSIDAEYVEGRYELVRSNYESESEFLERMAENLMTPEEFRENLGRQILLFSYLEELKRRDAQESVSKSINEGQSENGPFLEVTVERVPITKDDIDSISNKRAEELRAEFKVEVYLK